MPKTDNSLRKILIVGASSGLGEALAAHYQNEGRQVYTAARRRFSENLRVQTNFRVNLNSGRGLPRIAKRFSQQSCLVIITAGVIGSGESITKSKMKQWKTTLNTNLLGPLRVFRALHDVVARDSIFVFFSGGGVGGHSHQQQAADYVVSKTGLVALCEEIATETSGLGPTVVAVAPGRHETGFTKKAGGRRRFSYTEAVTSSESLQLDQLLATLRFIESCRPSIIAGRLFSANWDNFERMLNEQSLGESTFGYLRRVDRVRS